MTYVRRYEPDTTQHDCTPPMTGRWIEIPKGPAMGPWQGTVRASVEPTPDGATGDLWRCDHCDRLWRVGDACDACEHYGPGRHGGQHAVGTTWRPATLWQRFRYRKEGREA